MNAAKCPVCAGEMTHSGTTVTLVGYRSPAEHNHDDNCRVRLYSCKCGHREAVSKQNHCPACDWVGKEICFCHPGKKVREWPEDVPTK